MEHRATDIAQANLCFMSHLRALRCNHWREYLIQQRTTLRIVGGWYVKETSMFYAVARQEREKEKCESNRCIEVVRAQVAKSSDNLILPCVWYTWLTVPHRPTKQNRSRRRQEATLLRRRHAVLRGIDFQRAARRGETCFDDDADHYPSYAAAKSAKDSRKNAPLR